jgi:hypothetical protein
MRKTDGIYFNVVNYLVQGKLQNIPLKPARLHGEIKKGFCFI